MRWGLTATLAAWRDSREAEGLVVSPEMLQEHARLLWPTMSAQMVLQLSATAAEMPRGRDRR